MGQSRLYNLVRLVVEREETKKKTDFDHIVDLFGLVKAMKVQLYFMVVHEFVY